MNVPQNLKYTRDHEWVEISGNKATVGITDFAQSELGDIVFLEVETVGEKLNQAFFDQKLRKIKILKL